MSQNNKIIQMFTFLKNKVGEDLPPYLKILSQDDITLKDINKYIASELTISSLFDTDQDQRLGKRARTAFNIAYKKFGEECVKNFSTLSNSIVPKLIEDWDYDKLEAFSKFSGDVIFKNLTHIYFEIESEDEKKQEEYLNLFKTAKFNRLSSYSNLFNDISNIITEKAESSTPVSDFFKKFILTIKEHLNPNNFGEQIYTHQMYLNTIVASKQEKPDLFLFFVEKVIDPNYYSKINNFKFPYYLLSYVDDPKKYWVYDKIIPYFKKNIWKEFIKTLRESGDYKTLLSKLEHKLKFI